MPPNFKPTNDNGNHGVDLAAGGETRKCILAPEPQKNGKSTSRADLRRKNSVFVEGWAAHVHDDVNLAVLAILAMVAAWSMYKGDARTQYVLTVSAAGYMVLDAVWITCNPSGVKSPKTVLSALIRPTMGPPCGICEVPAPYEAFYSNTLAGGLSRLRKPNKGHHVATLSVLMDPLLQPQHAFYTACALLVEFNTFLLILRRRVSWGRYLEVPFALSWVALRLVWYPFLGFYMAMCAFPETLAPKYPERLVQWRTAVEGNQAVPMFVGSFIAWVGICLFQGWWSCALVKSYSRPAKRDQKFL